ncbi:unnamed protein product (macronuclear) [Paramecium tetraurelia]|uniref:Iron-binding zinc finger CDGSH type domain-containing protein n=1 Tax=Paramecium tetraurelia TaxID=5888 RepID=A0BTT4_PARTE|nr:uncharacterized protein GSPATT00032183001 [Paramecium tetraurelia]CAK61951.1 unnamed protein product [Paramecium tetraurelia]|eukprot:XP_001429349.1 hypothetical protein (macronuclear) [Paramecium tetraurelia strain d4-2]
MSQILKKAAKYRSVSTILQHGEAHLRDPYTLPPEIVTPPPPRKERKPDDITDFPEQKFVLLPESIPYPEGKYRPASVPYVAGFYPYNCYLQKGKIYQWCSCGISQSNPWCDGMCNASVTRNRPIKFNVDTSGYYKLCNCKQSANAPFCNGTHRQVIRQYHDGFRGFYELWGWAAFMGTTGFMVWNFHN